MNTNLSKTRSTAWRLFITAHAKLIDVIDANLTSAQQIPLHWYDVLIELYEAADHRLRMHDLAARVVLSRSGLTRLVDRLEKEGLLHREIDPNDRRGFHAIITNKGIEALRSAWPVYAQGIADYFAADLSEADAETFVRVLAHMLARLDKNVLREGKE